jgi:hypothetical protein
MDIASKQEKPRRKWETPEITVLAFRDTRGIKNSYADSFYGASYS